MPNIVETGRPSDWLKREADSLFSREQVTIVSGAGELASGTVLGAITLDAEDVTAEADAGNTGNGVLTVADPATEAGAKPGVYVLTAIEPAANAGRFQIEDPDGVVIGTATVAVAYDGVIKFTIADGSTDFVAGDVFRITVAAGSGKYTAVTAAGADGSQTAAAILLEAVDATSADVSAVVIARDAIVSNQGLSYGADVNTSGERAAVHAALAALNPPIIVREGA